MRTKAQYFSAPVRMSAFIDLFLSPNFDVYCWLWLSL